MPPSKKSKSVEKTTKKRTTKSEEDIAVENEQDTKRVKRSQSKIISESKDSHSTLLKNTKKRGKNTLKNDKDEQNLDNMKTIENLKTTAKNVIKASTGRSGSAVTRKRTVKTEIPDVDTLVKLKKKVLKIESTGKKYIGAHVSITGGVHNAVTSAVEIGAKAFAIFLRSQRQWACKPLTEDVAAKFRQACNEHNFPPHLILPHGSYLMNCGSPKQETLEKSRAALIDELKRCEMLGLTMFNFHPGSTCGEISIEKCVNLIAESINLAHEQTKYVTTVIENMSCQGNTIGGNFKELREIVDQVKDKSRIGICLDTCHAFAAGYDLATEEGYNKMMGDFESIIGLQYLKGVHLNDSAGKVGCHLDRHENIGMGHIGLEGFRRLMKDPRFNDIPLILETPLAVDDADEIKLLYRMCK